MIDNTLICRALDLGESPCCESTENPAPLNAKDSERLAILFYV